MRCCQQVESCSLFLQKLRVARAGGSFVQIEIGSLTHATKPSHPSPFSASRTEEETWKRGPSIEGGGSRELIVIVPEWKRTENKTNEISVNQNCQMSFSEVGTFTVVEVFACHQKCGRAQLSAPGAQQ